MQSLLDAFKISPGVTAIVGGGGKTSLMNAIAREIAGISRAITENRPISREIVGRKPLNQGVSRSCGDTRRISRVIISTTTKIWPPEMTTLIDPTPREVEAALKLDAAICVASRGLNGKLGAPGKGLLDCLDSLAPYVIIEADGAKGLPLKAPCEYEPVIPLRANKVIAVAGLDAIGRTILKSAFRPELYARIVGKSVDDIVTVNDVAKVLTSQAGQRKGVTCDFCVALNKADTAGLVAIGRECGNIMRGERVVITSFMEANILCETV